MAKGFQRILDLSSLSIKLLNDQLAQLWAKVMGGIELRDMTASTREALNTQVNGEYIDELSGKVTSLSSRVKQTEDSIQLAVLREDVGSVIQQNADAVRMCVGRIAGENLVRNGAAAFGLTAWHCADGAYASTVEDDALGRSCFLVAGSDGAFAQSGATLRAGASYVLWARLKVEEGEARINIWDKNGDTLATSEWFGPSEGFFEVSMVIPPADIARACTYSMRIKGRARMTDVQLEEGVMPTGWRPHQGELGNAGISITEDLVRIDARNFELVLCDESGAETMQMKAGVQGFADLYVSENLYLRGRGMYLGPGEYALFVHPDAPAGQGKWFYEHTPPAGLSGCFKEIQSAIDFIPRWCDGDVTVHVYGQAGFSYPASVTRVSSFFGGGSIKLSNWQPGAPKYTVRQVAISNNALPVRVDFANINASAITDCFSVQQAFATFLACNVNGRGILQSYGGYNISTNGSATISGCEAHNCQYGVFVESGGRAYLESCAGAGNNYGVMASTGGIAICSTQSSGIKGNIANTYELNGKVLSSPGFFQDGAAPAATQAETTQRFLPDSTRSYQEGLGWRDDGFVFQGDAGGGAMYGFVFFNRANLQAMLGGKTLRSARLTVKRRAVGGESTPVAARLRGFGNASASGVPQLVRDYGVIGSWARGESRGALIPASIVSDLLSGAVLSLGFYDEEGRVLGFEAANSQGGPTLDVSYAS